MPEKGEKIQNTGENFPPSSAEDVLDELLAEGGGATSDEEVKDEPKAKEEGEEAPKISKDEEEEEVRIPEKFLDEDGKFRPERFIKSYQELERELHEKSQRLTEYEKLLSQVLQAQTQGTPSPEPEKKEEEEEEDLGELLLTEPKTALEKLKAKLEQELAPKLQQQLLYSLYQSIPPEDRVEKAVAASLRMLPEEEQNRIMQNREKYEKVYHALMKRIGPERIEGYLLQYAQQNIPPVKFFIDIADAMEEAIKAKEKAIREEEKKKQEPVKMTRSSPPPEHKTEESLEKVADDVIKELGLF